MKKATQARRLRSWGLALRFLTKRFLLPRRGTCLTLGGYPMPSKSLQPALDAPGLLVPTCGPVRRPGSSLFGAGPAGRGNPDSNKSHAANVPQGARGAHPLIRVQESGSGIPVGSARWARGPQSAVRPRCRRESCFESLLLYHARVACRSSTGSAIQVVGGNQESAPESFHGPLRSTAEPTPSRSRAAPRSLLPKLVPFHASKGLARGRRR